MEKQSPINNNNQNMPPLRAGTSTSSGVTDFDPSLSSNNPPPPPSYDQAMGNTTSTSASVHTHTMLGWNEPDIGSQNTAYNIPTTHTTTTTYTTYQPSVPPQSSRNPQQPIFAQPPVVIIQQPPILPLGLEPVYLTCPACHVQKLTRIEYEPSSRTHLMAALLCLVGLWCCVCLPYCAGSCMNTHHYCGNCGKFLGTFENAL